MVIGKAVGRPQFPNSLRSASRAELPQVMIHMFVHAGSSPAGGARQRADADAGCTALLHPHEIAEPLAEVAAVLAESRADPTPRVWGRWDCSAKMASRSYKLA